MPESEAPAKKRGRPSNAEREMRDACPIGVTLTLRNGKERAFRAATYEQGNGFWKFYAPAGYGRVEQRFVAVSEIAEIVIETPQFYPMAAVAPPVDQPAARQPTSPPPSDSYVNPLVAARQQLRTSQVNGIPVSETAEGVVTAGFLNAMPQIDASVG